MITFNQEITNSGGTFTYDPATWGGGDALLYLYTTSSVTLASDISITVSSDMNQGSTFYILQSANNITRNGKRLTVTLPTGGYDYTDDWEFLTPSLYKATNVDGTTYFQIVDWELILGSGISGDTIYPESILLTKLADLTRGSIIRGNSSNRPAAYDAKTSGNILIGDGTDLVSVAQSGDVTFNTSGVSAITAGAIVNADINASAAIARTKIASGTASHVIINDGSGVLSSEAQLTAGRGGTGISTSASTGFPTISSGTWSVGAFTDSLRCDISFVTAAQGTYYVRVPFACTVTAAKARVTSTVSGSDDGTITFKDNSGTNMTGGLITIPASSAHGTGVTCTMSANNTFTANQEIQLLVAKTTSGGLCSVDITITRTS